MYTDIILNNYVFSISLYLAHILLNNGVADFVIPHTNKLSDFIILFMKLTTNLRNSSPKYGLFRFTNMTKALLYNKSLTTYKK